MPDLDREGLTYHSKPVIFSQLPSGTISTPLTASSIIAPPFAPQPHLARPGTTSDSSSNRDCQSRGVPVVSSSSQECSIHEFCYYFQQIIFISAIATGFALVVAGVLIHPQNSDLFVFVYIGSLLMIVNSGLLIVLCYVRRKQKRRARVYLSGHPPPLQCTQRLGAVHYNALPTQPNQQPGDQPLKFVGTSLTNVPSSDPLGRYQSAAFRSGSVGSQAKPNLHHHHTPFHQQHSPVLTPRSRMYGFSQPSSTVLTPRSEIAPPRSLEHHHLPPSYDDLLHTASMFHPQPNTTIHLL